MRVLALIIAIGLLTSGCTTSGTSYHGTISAPTTIRPPDVVNPELAGYGQEIIAPLVQDGFKVGNTGDPDALRLEVAFNPNPFSMSVTIRLIKPGAGVIASAQSVNSGFGTMVAHNSAVQSRVESAIQSFSEQLANIHFVITPDKNDFAACFSNLANSPELATIRQKVGLDGVKSQTFSMLADNSKPTDQEKLALRKWGDMRDVCLKQIHESMSLQRVPMQILNVNDASAMGSQSLLVELVNGNMTYSEFAKKRSELSAFVNDKIAQIDAVLRAQSADAQYKANQIAIEAQQNSLMQQKIISDQNMQQQQINNERQMMSRPTMTNTNCRAVGNQVNCDTISQ